MLDRVARGESLVVTRDGAEVAELVPLRRRARSIAELIVACRALPKMDLDRLRADLDQIMDPGL